MKTIYYSTLDICKALDIRRERLRDWIDREFITPLRPSGGQGRKALFNIQDAYSIALFKWLIDRGFKRDAVAKMLELFNISLISDAIRIKYIAFFFEGEKIITCRYSDDTIFKAIESVRDYTDVYFIDFENNIRAIVDQQLKENTN